jgi:Tfp pilus assembly protein FimT
MELVIVIAIMSIVTTVAVFAIGNSLRQSRLREATRLLEGELETVKNTARTQQRKVAVEMTAAGIRAFYDMNNNWTYEVGTDYIDRNANGVYDAGVDQDGIFLVDTFRGGVQFVVTSTGAGAVAPLTTLRFNEMGNLDDANRIITISMNSEPRRQYRIWVYQTGSTRVERSDDAGATWPTRPW